MSLTQDRVLELFQYDPESGILYRKKSRSGVSAGPAGCKSTALGYIIIGIDGGKYYAHRVIWLYIHGKMPNEVDHINGVRDDNRLSNLREADSSSNKANRGIRPDNRSGLKWVGFHPQSGKWRARVRKNGAVADGGLHATPELAHQAALVLATKLHGEFVKC